jgi:hypothetical protein
MARLTINEKEQESLDKWKKAISELYEDPGNIHFTVNVTGIGTTVIAHSSKVQVTKDITDYSSW